MAILGPIVAFIAALVAVAGILKDDSGPNNGGAGAGLAAVGVVGLFLSIFMMSAGGH